MTGDLRAVVIRLGMEGAVGLRRSWVVLPLIVACSICSGEDIPPEWGEMWQAQLPETERHPSLFYDESDRERMLERLYEEPWARWWGQLERIGLRHKPALKWWLLGDEEQAAQAREDLVEKPIWREESHGYLEPSSHRFSDYVVAYDLLASRVLGCSALGMAALVLREYQDGEIGPAKWLGRALHEIRRDETFWFFRPGGLFVEGLGYTSYMNVQFVQFAIAYERATGKYLFEDARLREWLTFAASCARGTS